MLNPWEDLKSIININTTKNNSINCLNVNNTKEADPFCSKQFLVVPTCFSQHCQKKRI